MNLPGIAGAWRCASVAAFFLAIGIGAARGDTFTYVTSLVPGQITAWDLNTGTSAVVVAAGSDLEGTGVAGSYGSLVFASKTQLFYSIIGGASNNGDVALYSCPAGFSPADGTCLNPATSSNVVLSSSSLFHSPYDLAIDPGGVSTAICGNGCVTSLVGNSAANTIDRVILTDPSNPAAVGTTTVFADFGGIPHAGQPAGLAYDGASLYVVLGQDEVAQLDPSTGAIIQTSALLNEADGLTYDSTTGMLYVASDAGGYYTINPATLVSSALQTISGIPGNPTPDFTGIASSASSGFIVQRNSEAIEFNLATGAELNVSPAINAAEGVALEGSPASTPEPGTMLLIGAGLLVVGAMGMGRRRNRF